jgi:hypothetical protein
VTPMPQTNSKRPAEGFDNFIILVCWLIWKERNAWVFNNLAQQLVSLVSDVWQEGRLLVCSCRVLIVVRNPTVVSLCLLG